MTDTNLTLVLHAAKDLRLEDRPIPEPAPGEVQLSIRSVGICGSDVKYWQYGGIGTNLVKAPMALGHEPCGVVTKLGQGVTNVKVGDRVALEPNKPCGMCRFCRIGNYNVCANLRYLASPPTDGALCRSICHPASSVHKLPDNVSFDEGAVVQPLSLGFYACRRADVKFGDYVLVTGAGPLGMAVVLVAKALGAAKICVTEIDEARLQYIKKIGADVAVLTNPEEDPQVTSKKVLEAVGREVDVSIECSGQEIATSTAIYSTRTRGVVLQVGFGPSTVQIPLLAVTRKEIEIRGMIRFANCYPVAIEAIASGKINVKQLITHRFPLKNALDAYDASLRRVGVKIIIDCQKETEKS